MTTSQIIACVIAWIAAAVAVWALISIHRAGRSIRARERTFPICDGGGMVTFDRRMSDAEVEEFKARWRDTYGKPGTAHSVTSVGEEETGA